jgi:hypothetical protein
MRAIIRAEAYSLFASTTNHTHGYAVRIYAYSNLPFVKVDYQLQNSAKNVQKSWPLYFEAANIDLQLGLSNPQVIFGTTDTAVTNISSRTGATYLAQNRHDSFAIFSDGRQIKRRTNMDYTRHFGRGNAFMHLKTGASAFSLIGRNFWQLWPNGLKYQKQGSTVTYQLFPSWSAQWEQANGKGRTGRVSPTGLYWLNDMQHVYKEMLYVFHDSVPLIADVMKLTKTFQFRPVCSVDVEWHKTCKATFDLGGNIPKLIPTSRERTYNEYYLNYNQPLNVSNTAYVATWRAWGDPEVGYRNWAYTAGGMPYSNEAFSLTGDSDDYFLGELNSIGEINTRPQWMAGYNYKRDQSFLLLTAARYPPETWRIFDAWDAQYAAPLLPGTIQVQPYMVTRDNAHGWFYYVFHAYFYTANPWVKDWYEFIREFRKTRLVENFQGAYDSCSRCLGHMLHHAYQAARITDDPDYIKNFLNFLRIDLRANMDPANGLRIDESGGFQVGYLMRSIVVFLEQSQGVDAQAYAEGFQHLSGLVSWNLNYGNFAYSLDIVQERTGTKGESEGSGLMVDSQAWYYWNTGIVAYWNHILDYRDGGINGGYPPYNNLNWSLDFVGRMFEFVLSSSRPDMTPPVAINDLSASLSNGMVRLQWTSPADAIRFHIVWSNLTISEAQTRSTSRRNWWAAETVGTTLKGVPGTVQSVTFPLVGSTTKVNVAIFSFDKSNNMSRMSNVATTTTGLV